MFKLSWQRVLYECDSYRVLKPVYMHREFLCGIYFRGLKNVMHFVNASKLNQSEFSKTT